MSQRVPATAWVLHRLGGSVAGAAAFLAAVRLPDVDAALGLHHRSALTHSILLPILVLSLAWMVVDGLRRRRRGGDPGAGRPAPPPDDAPFRAVLALFLIGFAVHMTADCVPASWQGRALIYFPGPGGARSFGAANEVLSALWIGVNAVLAFAWCHRILEPEGRGVAWLYQAATLVLVGAYAILVDAHRYLAVPKLLVGLLLIAAGHAAYRTAGWIFPAFRLSSAPSRAGQPG